MHPNLAGVDLRLRRADECLALLDRKRTRLLNAKRDRMGGHFYADAFDHGYVFRVLGRQPPLSLGLTVGEFAHSLRATLDNLLWQLILARGSDPEVGHHRQFPIYENETRAMRKTKGGTPQIEAETNGVKDVDLAFIKGCQPYQYAGYLTRWHPLAMLAHLNNVDKHRYIHAAYAAAAEVPIDGLHAGRAFFKSAAGHAAYRDGVLGWKPGDQFRMLGLGLPVFPSPDVLTDNPSAVVQSVGLTFDGSANDPAEIARVHGVRPARRGAHMQMQPGFLLDISFSDRERPMNIFDLREIRDFVRDIVDRFRPVVD